MSLVRLTGLVTSDFTLQAGGACRRVRPRRAGSVTRSPDSQRFALRAGRGGPTPPVRRGRTLRHPPDFGRGSLVNSPVGRLMLILFLLGMEDA